jgi:uncharacterized protein YegL
MARIAGGFDRFGNPEGRAFDLGGGDEDRVRGESVLLYTCKPSAGAFGAFAEQEMRILMAERGLRLDILHAPPSGGCPLDAQLLAGYTQLWIISSDRPTLSGQQVQMIVSYVRSGNGLAIWADNEPYYADANLLARALTGSSFSGNRPGDKVMVPGPPDTAGRFVEHQLTQGVNNLYEGITICTIDPVPGITILGRSHDGQRCLGCFEREGQRVVLDAGFTKLYSMYYHKSAGLGRYLSNIAFWLARGSRGVEYELLSPGRSEIASVKKGETSKEYRFAVSGAAAATCIVQWDGKATLGVTVRAPDGSVAGRGSSPSSPLKVTVLTPTPGTWTCTVEGLDVPPAGMTYAAKVALEIPGSHSGTGRPATPGKGRVVLPFYLVCDVSAAAAGTIRDFAVALQKLKHGLMRVPAIDETVALSLITFDETARTVAALAAPSAIELPTLSAGGGASFSAAIREYHRALEKDRARLKAGGAKVFRPCVFFLAHGAPKDRYQETFRSLLGFDSSTGQGNRAYPNVIAIGLPGATRESLAGLAYPDFGDPARRGRWFVTDPAPTALDGYRPMVQIIYQTITATHATGTRGIITFTPPTSIPGTQSGVAGA